MKRGKKNTFNVLAEQMDTMVGVLGGFLVGLCNAPRHSFAYDVFIFGCSTTGNTLILLVLLSVA